MFSRQVAKSDREQIRLAAIWLDRAGCQPILQKDTGIARIGSLNRIATAVGDFQQAASLSGVWSGQCAGAEQITALKVAAAEVLVRYELRGCPIHTKATSG